LARKKRETDRALVRHVGIPALGNQGNMEEKTKHTPSSKPQRMLQNTGKVFRKEKFKKTKRKKEKNKGMGCSWTTDVNGEEGKVPCGN